MLTKLTFSQEIALFMSKIKIDLANFEIFQIEAVTTALSCDLGCEQEVDLMKEDLEKLLDNRKYKNQDYGRGVFSEHCKIIFKFFYRNSANLKTNIILVRISASSSVKSIFVSDIYCASCSTSKTIDLGDDATRLSCGECNGVGFMLIFQVCQV